MENSSSEYSESSYETSSSETDEEEYYPWMKNVGANGELFYIQPNFSTLKEKNTTITADSGNCYFATEKDEIKSNPRRKLKHWLNKQKIKAKKLFPTKYSKFDISTEKNVLFDPFSLPFIDIVIDINNYKQVVKCDEKLSGKEFRFSEELLGLELGIFEDIDNTCGRENIQILGFKSSKGIDQIMPGDWLYSINGTIVHSNNIDDICNTISVPSKITLTTIKVAKHLDARSKFNYLSTNERNIDDLLGSSDVIKQTKLDLLNVAHCIFYFLVSEESHSESEEIFYKYPSENNRYFQLKNLFTSTCYVVSEDVASAPLLSCTVLIQEELVHVAFVKEKNEAFAIVFPSSSCTISEAQDFATNLVRLLKFQFSSLKLAFGVENNKTFHDHFFTMFFKHTLLSSQINYCDSHFFNVLPSVHWLPLPENIKIDIDDLLSELESSDCGINVSDYKTSEGYTKIYSIYGSCLFYKGYLLCNHLPKTDLLDIHSFLQYNNLLLLTRLQRVAEVIIWREVFPSRLQNQQFSDSDFIEVNGRWFMLIIAMNNCVLVVLLEAGGCCQEIKTSPPPVPFYVEEVQNALLILHECGIISAAEKLLHQSLPPVVSPDAFIKEGSAFARNFASSIFQNTKISSANTNLLKKNANHSSNSSLRIEKGHTDCEADLQSCSSLIDNDNLLNHKKSRIKQSDRTNSRDSSTENLSQENRFSAVTTSSNTLFQYLHIDPVDGVFIAPICTFSSFQESALKYIWIQFFQSCLKLRKVFARSLRNEEIINSHTLTKFGVDSLLQNVDEQKLTFCYKQKDSQKQKIHIMFQVVGRLFFTPEPRELYICHHDSVQQDIVEIAFRLGFGLVV